MDKMQFENGTLVSTAKVVIDGVEHEVIPAVYEGKTPFSAENINKMQDNIEKFIKLMHPIGSIYMTTVSTNPAEIFGFGEWVPWGGGRVPVGFWAEDEKFNEVEKIGGEFEHTLTVDEMPSHNHTIDTHIAEEGQTERGILFVENSRLAYYDYEAIHDVGGNQPHNNLQPYIVCYMWKRTA